MKRHAFTAALLSFLLQGVFAQQNTLKPDARARAHLIYHPASNEIFLINGYNSHTDSTQNNVWKWDGNRWKEIVAYGPGSIVGDAAALNSKTGEIIIFGGWGKGGFDKDSRNEVWSFNGRKWNKVETNIIDKHDHHKMVYADHLHAFVIYGGRNAASGIPDSTTWILKDGVFTPLQIPGPGASGNAGFAYDRERKKVVLFSAKAYNIPANLWEFDGQRWEKIPVGDIGITTGQNMVYCDHLRMTVVNGYTGTFGWDGKKMIKLADAGPSGANTALGYDPERKVIVAYGGFGDNRSISSALWELKGNKWEKILENQTRNY